MKMSPYVFGRARIRLSRKAVLPIKLDQQQRDILGSVFFKQSIHGGQYNLSLLVTTN